MIVKDAKHGSWDIVLRDWKWSRLNSMAHVQSLK